MRAIPHYDFLSTDQVEAILNQAEWLMEEIGLRWADHPNSLEIWKKAGADVRGDMVHLPRGMARGIGKDVPNGIHPGGQQSGKQRQNRWQQPGFCRHV